MHASALAFEFGRDHDLVVCNCGPSQSDEEESALLFRQGIAHSGPTINAISAASIPVRGPLRDRVVAVGRAPEMAAEQADHSLLMRTYGYADRFGVVLERRLTLAPPRTAPRWSGRTSSAASARACRAPAPSASTLRTRRG